MIAFLIHGIQKDLAIPEKYYAFIVDSENDEEITNTSKIFESLQEKSLLNIEILSHTSFSTDEEIDLILQYTEDCEQFFNVPKEIAEHLLMN